MKVITNWLIEMEERAAVAYEQASSLLSDDADLSALLKRLAVDERTHLETLQGATRILDELPDSGVPLIRLDDDTKVGIVSGFASCERQIKDGSLSKNGMIECLVATEFSEWNGLFLYVINALSRRDGAYTAVKPKIQQHKRLIERYLQSLPDADVYLKRIAQLPIVWQEKILVVDDYAMITDMLSALLEDEGAIDVARNGMEALEKLKTNYYAAVISDVDMPVMNGVRFYEQAVKIYPAISERFLFFTGSTDDERMDFFQKTGSNTSLSLQGSAILERPWPRYCRGRADDSWLSGLPTDMKLTARRKTGVRIALSHLLVFRRDLLEKIFRVLPKESHVFADYRRPLRGGIVGAPRRTPYIIVIHHLLLKGAQFGSLQYIIHPRLVGIAYDLP